jgi:hypothetical protein
MPSKNLSKEDIETLGVQQQRAIIVKKKVNDDMTANDTNPPSRINSVV